MIAKVRRRAISSARDFVMEGDMRAWADLNIPASPGSYQA
jgi:hypothetical protein